METKKTYATRIQNWLNYLRYGDFKQSRGRYHGKNGGHCCLGVAQIVAGLSQVERFREGRIYYGLDVKDTNYLIRLNDDGHRNFAYIADRIEKKILPKFLT